MMRARHELAKEPIAPAIDRIQQVLASFAAPGKFAVRRTIGAEVLRIDVVDFGQLPLPLESSTARQLIEVATPARYGLRDKTLLDRRVRDTWEIDKRDLEIDLRRWQPVLAFELEHIGRDLGVPAGTKLRAELHNLLVYGPGQFFAPHQDSEKADGMIGSLVVLLPSKSSGGALAITHHDEQLSFRGSPDQIVLAAFYADCRHEVRRVTRGYRAALTYNLFFDGKATPPPRSAEPLDSLVELVREHFATPRHARSSLRPAEQAPERLVYLLDHEYTQKGLSWHSLKNGDALRAALLREVADRLDCDVVLALADVHETWACEDDWDQGYRRNRNWYAGDNDNDDDDEPDGAADYKLIELCDSDVELRHWISPAGEQVAPLSDDVSGDEICFTKPSVELAPFQSEHEGYTGNAGNTVDRWYHRAAVLLWPRARAFAIHAKAAPGWAIREVAKALTRGETDQARGRVSELLPFWNEVAPRERVAAFADHVLRVANEIDDAELASALVEPLRVDQITPKTGPRWTDLLAGYGLSWCVRIFERWSSRDERSYDHQSRMAWLASTAALWAPVCARSGDAVELVRRVVRSQWSWLDARLGEWSKPPLTSYSRKTLADAGRPIVGLLAAAALAEDHEIQSTIAERLAPERGYPHAGALAVLRAGAPHGGAMLGLTALHDACVRALSEHVASKPRAPGNWAITAALSCKCELCAHLGRFLRAANHQHLEWPLAKDRRAHVHRTIDSYELPVTHVTRRTGSPHTLVLTKTRALFTREATERDAWTRDLAWLRKNARAFADADNKARRRIARPTAGRRSRV